MEKLSKITEGRLSRNIQTSFGNQERIEDKTNVNDMKPVVVDGANVYWADIDLVMGGTDKFSLTEIDGFTQNGWRLPTREEADYLLSMKNNGKILDTLFGFDDKRYTPILNYWETAYDTKERMGAFSVKKEGIFYPHSVYVYVVPDTDLFKVRLVKDK